MENFITLIMEFYWNEENDNLKYFTQLNFAPVDTRHDK